MKILWIGDAVAPTGFERCTRAACDAFYAAGHDVRVLGINYDGDPHEHPWPIHPAARSFRREDAFGVERTAALVQKYQPDVVCILQDPWNIPEYIRAIRQVRVEPSKRTPTAATPVVAWLAVDGRNCRGFDLNDLRDEDHGWGKETLQGPALSVFWTEFGEREARLGGYTGNSAVVQLGVDLDLFRPHIRIDARRRIGFPAHLEDAFVVGLVGRNQERKRIDLAIAYFADWIRSRGVDDAVLLAHVAPTGNQAWNLAQLAHHYGLQGRFLTTTKTTGQCIPESELCNVYAAMDLLMTTTQGEGWGLPVAEAMACGVPSIVPDWSALGEWPKDAAWKVPCSEIAHTTNSINAQGGIADRREFIAGLDRLYHDRELRETLRARGLALVNEPRFRWENVGAAFVAAVEDVVEGPVALPELAEVAG